MNPVCNKMIKLLYLLQEKMFAYYCDYLRNSTNSRNEEIRKKKILIPDYFYCLQMNSII